MDKQTLISIISSRLSQLGILGQYGNGTDITIYKEFLEASWGTGNKKIEFFASAFFDESHKTLFYWELTKETGGGIAFGSGSDTFSQSGMTLTRNVRGVGYGLDGKTYEYDFDIGSILSSFKDLAIHNGWNFQQVLRREMASFPYQPIQNNIVPKSVKNPGKGFWAIFAISVLVTGMVFIVGGVSILGWILTALLFAGAVIVQKKEMIKSKIGRVALGGAVLVALLMIIGLTAPGHDKEMLSLGQSNIETIETIGESGGNILISDVKSPIYGMSIHIPAGTYDKEINIQVETTAIDKHQFGNDFIPVTPLITVDNAHIFANELVTVSIPITITKDEFAMAFYYDSKNGTLEGLPVVDQSEDSITIATAHFSDIVVSKIQKKKLDNIQIDTGYTPGVDDWQFVNNGTFIEPDGHCAGQSISSMWHYNVKYQKQGEERLYGKFDNNGSKTPTKNFDYDDSWSYRFASVVQKKINWDSNSKKIFNVFRGTNGTITYYTFAYSMLLTGNPQYTGICYYNAKGEIGGGHAVVAYKIENHTIYIADPNYPGNITRKILFDVNNGTFIPYESGANATEIALGNSIKYTHIGYFAVSAMIDLSVVDAEYDKMTAGKSGDGIFPEDDPFYVLMSDSKGNRSTVPLADGFIITPDEMKWLDPNSVGYIYVAPKKEYSDVKYTFYLGTSPFGSIIAIGENNDKWLKIKLNQGINDIGILVEIEDKRTGKKGSFKYVNFNRYKVNFTDGTKYEESSESSTISGSSSLIDSSLLSSTNSSGASSSQPTKEYDYNAALAAWQNAYVKSTNKSTRDEYWGQDHVYTIEFITAPNIKMNGPQGPGIYGRHQIWDSWTYYIGENIGKTGKSTVNGFAKDTAHPEGLYISLSDLRAKYPQFEK